MTSALLFGYWLFMMKNTSLCWKEKVKVYCHPQSSVCFKKEKEVNNETSKNSESKEDLVQEGKS